MKQTVAKVVKEGLCTSCGICAGACHRGCISFHYGKERNVPMVATICVNCGLCHEICPGKGIALNKLSKELFSEGKNIKNDKIAGYYLETYVGHSSDEDIRYHSATGGMVTQFLMWLLQKKEIDGAVVVRYAKDNPFKPEPFIATTPEEIWESRSSKYVILSMDRVAKQIANGSYRNLVVVGLPCMIQGWRQLARRNKRVRDAIKGYFSIYCSVNKTKLSIDYYFQRYKIEKQNVGRFTFRDDGCMGFMKYENKEGGLIKKIPYKSYWFGTHSFFTNPRCLSCIDQFGDLADICFGDIHIKPYSDDTIGTNSVLTRSKYWSELLELCKENGAIKLDVIPVDTLVRSQIYANTYKKGAGAEAYIRLRKLLGHPAPIYDYMYGGRFSFINYLNAIGKIVMYEIGRRKHLWWLVRLLDK